MSVFVVHLLALVQVDLPCLEAGVGIDDFAVVLAEVPVDVAGADVVVLERWCCC